MLVPGRRSRMAEHREANYAMRYRTLKWHQRLLGSMIVTRIEIVRFLQYPITVCSEVSICDRGLRSLVSSYLELDAFAPRPGSHFDDFACEFDTDSLR